jgi:hypothetical protein
LSIHFDAEVPQYLRELQATKRVTNFKRDRVAM